MKKLYFFVVVLVLTQKVEAKKLQGQIYYMLDTVTVTMNIPINFLTKEPNYQSLQNKLKYIDSEGVKKILRPTEASEIRFDYNSESIRMLSRKNTLEWSNVFFSNTNIFLKLEIDGELQLFNYYSTQSSPGMYNGASGMMTGGFSHRTHNLILQKSNEELNQPFWLSFKDDMMEYFKGCPDLSDKIKHKEFRKKDLRSIVTYYNTNCK
ncbi:MAG: hypothetical protein AB8B61_09645 [Cyclobacteriaceae bacterium]